MPTTNAELHIHYITRFQLWILNPLYREQLHLPLVKLDKLTGLNRNAAIECLRRLSSLRDLRGAWTWGCRGISWEAFSSRLIQQIGTF